MSVGPSAAYTFKNVRYSSYISCVEPPNGYYYLTQSNSPCVFYAQGTNGGYLFSPEPSLDIFWDVVDLFDVVDVVILEPLPRSTVMILTRVNQSSTVTFSSTAATTGYLTGSPFTTIPTAATTSSSTSGGGITVTNKISLGVGIGIGVPSFLVAFISLLLLYLAKKRKKRALLVMIPELEVTPEGDEVEMMSVSTTGVQAQERVENNQDV